MRVSARVIEYAGASVWMGYMGDCAGDVQEMDGCVNF